MAEENRDEEQERPVPAPKKLAVDEDGNPISDYKSLRTAAEKRKQDAEFKKKLKTIGFSRVPGGGRENRKD